MQDPFGSSPYGRPASNAKNALGVWSLVCALSFFFCGPATFVGIFLGAAGRRAAKEGQATNGTLATAGMILSIVGAILWVWSVWYLFSSGTYDEIMNSLM